MNWAKKLPTYVTNNEEFFGLCSNAQFRFFSDALCASPLRGCVQTSSLQLENQRLTHKKIVGTLADPQLWIRSLVSSVWRGLEEGSMNLRS